jgi:hypothetical protein
MSLTTDLGHEGRVWLAATASHTTVKAATSCKAGVWLSIQLFHVTDFCID